MKQDETVISHTIYGVGPAAWGETKAEWLCNVSSSVDGQADLPLAQRRAEEYRAKGYTDVVVYEIVQRPAPTWPTTAAVKASVTT